MSDSGSHQGFEITKDGLKSFSDNLRGQLDSHLWPEGDAIGTAFRAGIPFGFRTVSPAVDAARQIYHQRLGESLRVLDAVLHNSEVLAQAAITMLEHYEDADALAAAGMDTVLSSANLTVTTTELPAAEARSAEEKAADLADRAARHGRGGIG
jgi:hypothetical protein